MDVLQLLTALITLTCIYLTTKQNPYCWPISIISCVLLVYIYCKSQLYCQVGLQLIYIIQCAYGWYNWGKNNSLKVTKISSGYFVLETMLFILFGCVLGIILSYTTNVTHPYMDGIIAFIGLLGNLYLTKKIIHAWLLFMVYNILLIIMLFGQGVYILCILNVILFTISLKGYSTWKRDITIG